MDLNIAMQKIEGDESLSKRFQEDPMPVLKELGVDTSNCKIADPSAAEDGITQLSDQDLEAVAGGRSISACIGIGVTEEV